MTHLACVNITFFQKDIPLMPILKQPPWNRLMSLQDFIAIPDNPRQRNTTLRLTKASKYLKNPSQAQMVVHVAVLPNGDMIKLDGHTRAMFWEQNPDLAPSQLNATMYNVLSKDEAAELYTHFDNLKAAENSKDQWTGAFRQIGFFPRNSRLQGGTGGYALKIAHNAWLGFSGDSKESPYAIAPQWKRELLLADRIEKMGSKQIHIGIWVAMFVTFRRYGESALPFWKAFFTTLGTTSGDSMDSIAFLRLKRSGMSAAKAMQDKWLASMALGCFRRWMNGNRLLKLNKRGELTGPTSFPAVDFLAPVRKKPSSVPVRQLRKAA